MVSHFTYGVAYLWCVAYLSWVDKRTGTYNVRNAMHTRAASVYFRAKEQTSLPRFTSRFPSTVGHPLILIYLELLQACLEYFHLVLQFKYFLLQGWYLIYLVLNGCQQIWNTQRCVGLYFLDHRLECGQAVFDVHKCGFHFCYGIPLFEDSIHQ